MHIKRITFTLAACLLLTGACTVPGYAQAGPGAAAPKDTYTCRVVPSRNHTSGYEILRNGQVFIRQLTKNGQPGAEGFRDKATARRVAELALKKLRAGESLPTISREELEALHAL